MPLPEGPCTGPGAPGRASPMSRPWHNRHADRSWDLLGRDGALSTRILPNASNGFVCFGFSAVLRSRSGQPGPPPAPDSLRLRP